MPDLVGWNETSNVKHPELRDINNDFHHKNRFNI